MKFEIVLLNFPFDDFSTSKLRPAVCLTNPISKHGHVILAPITSNLRNATEPTDILVTTAHSDFISTGLKVSSAIKLHRLLTASEIIIQKSIGHLPVSFHAEISDKLKQLFEIS
ncbi:MAG: type II toxin-antitoxin system PemK/MazF family toxin [Ginsengibacter sp.]